LGIERTKTRSGALRDLVSGTGRSSRKIEDVMEAAADCRWLGRDR
jgi:hypothetical protein